MNAMVLHAPGRLGADIGKARLGQRVDVSWRVHTFGHTVVSLSATVGRLS